jgi:hypothetical protein
MTEKQFPWVERVIKRTENDRKNLDGVDSVKGFGRLHLHCGSAVVKVESVVNSSEVDPATGDPKPVFMVKLYCRRHSVSSRIEEFRGE